MQPNVPFGGFKQSGHGRLGGIEGLHDFLQPKNIWMNLAAPEAAR
ncbi:MAG: aldehyde dehydrogenase family protein [Novosphingobium sp.]